MVIESTKSRSRKRRPGQTTAGGSLPTDISSVEPSSPAPISRRTWVVLSFSILAMAAFLRFYDLDLVPLHHDEGVNGNFLTKLVRDGYYRYDPANYHGPTLYYLSAIFPRLLRAIFGEGVQNRYGLTTVAIRSVTAIFGLATIGLILTLRRYLGAVGTLAAGFLLAVSPGAVYLSRYFIHETLFVFFTLALVLAALKYFESADPLYLILAATSAALLFATKETAIISVVVLLLALLITVVYRKLRRHSVHSDRRVRKKGQPPSEPDEEPHSFVARAGGLTFLALWVLGGVAVFLSINVILYSSLFTNFPKGVWDAIKTFEFWTKTGKSAHIHPLLTYFRWLLSQESPLLILGALGALAAVLRPTKPFALFSGLWAFGLIAAYSLISYKTPWLSLNFIIPLALISGHAVEVIYQKLSERGWKQRTRALMLGAVLLFAIGPLPGTVRALTTKKTHGKTMIPGYQTIDLNFFNYDNEDGYYVYVYAHTRRETLKLVEEIHRLAERAQQTRTGITIVSPEYWPLPWYLRDYNRVGYFGRMTPTGEPMVIASKDQADEAKATFGDRYKQVPSGFNSLGSFPLRPGQELLLYARRELLPD